MTEHRLYISVAVFLLAIPITPAEAARCDGDLYDSNHASNGVIYWQSDVFESRRNKKSEWCFVRTIRVEHDSGEARVRWSIAGLTSWTEVRDELSWHYCCDHIRDETDGPLEYGASGAVVPTEVHRGEDEPVLETSFSIMGTVLAGQRPIRLNLLFHASAIPSGSGFYEYRYELVNQGDKIHIDWMGLDKEVVYEAFSTTWSDVSFDVDQGGIGFREWTTAYGKPTKSFGDLVITSDNREPLLRVVSPGIVPKDDK